MTEEKTVFWKYQAPAIAFAVLIFVLSSIPDLRGPDLNIEFEDKWTHLVVYAVFGYLLARAFFYQKRFPHACRNFFWTTVLIGLLYGISDEFHQSFVPGRYAEVLDAVADGLGVILGALIFRYLRRQDRKKTTPHPR